MPASASWYRVTISCAIRIRRAAHAPSGPPANCRADMSLLLEALKKAEKAKEEAQRRAEAGSDAERTDLQLQSEAPAAAAEPRPVMTRDQLPEISTSLEIVSDDPKPAPAAAPETMPDEPAPRRRASEAQTDSAQSADRATGRKVFEAKFREPNPRLPFYIAMGALGTFAVGTVVYFYFELRSPPMSGPRARNISWRLPRIRPTATRYLASPRSTCAPAATSWRKPPMRACCRPTPGIPPRRPRWSRCAPAASIRWWRKAASDRCLPPTRGRTRSASRSALCSRSRVAGPRRSSSFLKPPPRKPTTPTTPTTWR